jgi:hypothetical protein
MNQQLFTLFFLFVFGSLFAQKQPRLVLPVGHLGGITTLDGSPNEKLLLTEDLNSDIIIIDSDKLIELQRHNFEGWKITSSSFLNDSSVISICNDTLVSVWNFYLDKIDFFPLSSGISKIYVENFGVYGIDNQKKIFELKFSSNKIFIKEFHKLITEEIYFKSEKEIFLVNGKNLLTTNLDGSIKSNRRFENEITALSWNTIGNILMGFDNGEIIECDSTFNIINQYKTISDRISVIGYCNDSVIISGSYDFSLVTQSKKEILSSFLFDDWIVGMVMNNKGIITCTWSGTINKVNEKLEMSNEFEIGLKKASFFCQRENNLFISFNDGFVCQFDLTTNQLINNYKINGYSIFGIDVNDDATELIVWNSIGVSIFSLKEKKIELNFKKENIVSAKFVPNSNKYIFCSTEYLFYLNNNLLLDSIPLIDSWSITETKDNSIIASGLNRLIEVNESGCFVKDLPTIGQIWTTLKINNIYLLGTSSGGIYKLSENDKITKLSEFPMGIDGIELLNDNTVVFNCENGQLLELEIKSKKRRIIADTKQEYGSWDFKLNNKSGKIIYPNSKSWDYRMDVDVLDFNGKLINKLNNVGGEVVCVSNSNKSIEFNQLDSNEVVFIVSDGTIKLWNINTEGNNPITQLGIDYYNLLMNELREFNINGAFLKSGLLKLPISGIDTLTLMNLKNGDWLVHDSKYRFDGTPGAIEKLYFTCGLEVVELNQVKDSLYVPNLVQRYLNGETLEHIPQIKNLQICGYTPLIEAIDSLNYKIVPRSGGVGEIAVFINGIQRLKCDSKSLEFENGAYHLTIAEPDIIPFKQSGIPFQIKVIAKTKDNSFSSRGVVIEISDIHNQTSLKPSIHAIMIGIDQYKDESLQLNYAAKDANDLHAALKLAAQNYFNVDDTNRVFFYNLTLSNVGKTGTENIRGLTPDRGNIMNTLQEIKRISKPEDIVLLFFAGHGEIVDKEQLLLLTTESTRDNFQGIKMNELLTLMNEIPAGKRILILDACHSGAAINNLDMAYYSGKRDVKDLERASQRLKELDKLANQSGFAIITASSSDQKALELPQFEHGLLTYSLLSALVRNKSALNAENQLVLEKWFITAEEEMKKLNKNQNAEKMVPVSFNLGVIDEKVRNSINITQIPMLKITEVINESQFLNDIFPYDNYRIREKLKEAFNALNHTQNKQVLLLDNESFSITELIIKYDITLENIHLKCHLIKNGNVFKTIEKRVPIDQLDSSLNNMIIEIYNAL